MKGRKEGEKEGKKERLCLPSWSTGAVDGCEASILQCWGENLLLQKMEQEPR